VISRVRPRTRTALPDELAEAALGEQPVPVLVDVRPVREAGVQPQHDQPVVAVDPGQGAHVGLGTQPVDAGQRPELDEHDPPAQLGATQRR
jgi:hypothetical protein